MVDEKDLKNFIIESLKEFGGKRHYIAICKWVWKNHQKRLKNSGDLFFTWQYDIRRAATDLRKEGILKQVDNYQKGVWELR